jgi:hypothetical protein
MFLGSRERPVHSADHLAAICEPTVQTMWDPQHLTTLRAFMACYGDSFTLPSEQAVLLFAVSYSGPNRELIKTL